MIIKKLRNLKISIITVSYNSDNSIKQTLESVKNQKFKNIEHIIIDGKSTDKTILIAKEFSHVKKIISEPDEGIYHAMNKGIHIATGDIIGFLNSDDFYANNDVLCNIASEFEKDMKLEACYADLIYVNSSDPLKIVRYYKTGELKHNSFLKGWAPPHPTFYAKRKTFERLGKFNSNYRLAADFDLMLRFLEVNKIKSSYVPEIWVKMKIGGASNKNMKNIWIQNKEIFDSFKKNGIKIKFIFFLFLKVINRFQQYLKKKL